MKMYSTHISFYKLFYFFNNDIKAYVDNTTIKIIVIV